MSNNRFKLIFIFLTVLIFNGINLIPLIDGNIQKNNYSLNIINSNFCSFSNNALLTYWTLNEGSGNIAHDYSGHNMSGIINGATWTTGYSSFALNFDGINDYINVDEHAQELGFNKTDDYKISAWFKTESIHQGIIYMVSDDSDAIPVFYVKIKSDGTIEMKVQSTSSCIIQVNTEDSYNDGMWHFVEGIYHGSEGYPDLELYIDNEFVATDYDWLCPMSSSSFNRAKIGMASYETADSFLGVIDEIKIYKQPEENLIPNPPEISGPIVGAIGEVYNFTFFISDPELDELFLGVKWGDNTSTSWLGPYISGEEVILNHTWSENGTYEINASARDPFDIGEPSIIYMVMGNIAPDKPIIIGPTRGNKNELNEYTFFTTDLNNNNVKYYIDWGDGNNEWTDYYLSGEKVKLQHSWNETGIYTITSKAIDNQDAESELSNPFTATITEKTFIIGLISNYISDEDFLIINSKILIYINLEPINTKFVLSEDKIIVSKDYLGKINNNFIYGIFNSAII